MTPAQSPSNMRSVGSGLAAIAFALVGGVVGFGLLFISGFGHPVSTALVWYSVVVMVVSAATLVWGVMIVSTRSGGWTGALPGVSVTWLILVVLGLVLVVSPSSSSVPACVRTEQVVTGRMDQDLIGSWFQTAEPNASTHPLTQLAVAHISYEFQADGRGLARWDERFPGGEGYGERAFSWRIEGGLLFVDDLPPASVSIDVGTATISNADDGGESVLWRRCEGSD